MPQPLSCPAKAGHPVYGGGAISRRRWILGHPLARV